VQWLHAGIFWVVLKLQCMLLEEEIVSLKLFLQIYEIKFGNLLMNWFIGGKCLPVDIINVGL
jgi:hypothetical protein